jgi:hypothetical protein
LASKACRANFINGISLILENTKKKNKLCKQPAENLQRKKEKKTQLGQQLKQ